MLKIKGVSKRSFNYAYYALILQVTQCARFSITLQLICIALQDGYLVFQCFDLIVVMSFALSGLER